MKNVEDLTDNELTDELNNAVKTYEGKDDSAELDEYCQKLLKEVLKRMKGLFKKLRNEI